MVADQTAIVESEPPYLHDLFRDANSQHAACKRMTRKALDHARECGQFLLQAKSLCGHGRWEEERRWQFKGSARTARVYMRIAENWSDIEDAKRQGSAVSSIDQAIRVLSKPKPDTEQPTNQSSSVDHDAEDHVNDDNEHFPRLVQPSTPKVSESPRSSSPPDRGIEVANKIIDLFKTIPRDDKFRDRAFEIVTDWIEQER